MAKYMAILVLHIHRLTEFLLTGRSCDVHRAASVYPMDVYPTLYRKNSAPNEDADHPSMAAAAIGPQQ